MAESIIYIFLGVTLLVLVVGIVLMAVGGKYNKKYANKMMFARVAFQAATIMFLLLLFFLL